MARRWWIVVGLLAAASLLGHIGLPYVDTTGLQGSNVDRSALSIGALGLIPLVTAAFLVELALLLRPGWRVRRGGRYDSLDRASVRRIVLGGALLVALVQAWFVYRYLESLSAGSWGFDVLSSNGSLVAAAVVASLLGGFVLTVLLGLLLERHGLGSGVALLLAAPLVTALPSTLARLGRMWRSEQLTLPGALLLLAALVAVALITRWMLGRGPQSPSFSTLAADLPARPTAGLVPLVIATTLLGLPVTLRNLGVSLPSGLLFAPGVRGYTEALILVTVLVGALLSALFSRRWSGDPTLRWRAIGESMIGLVALALIQQKLDLPVLLVAHATATALDALDEAKARGQQGDLEPCWQWPSVATLDGALRKLRAAGIVVHPRGALVRRLYWVFGPHIPIDLLVPPRDVERAVALLAASEAS